MTHKIDEGSSMKYANEFNSFFQLMENEMEGHNYVYKDRWTNVDPLFLLESLKLKIAEYELSKNPKKLISLANFSMLLYIKSKGELK